MHGLVTGYTTTRYDENGKALETLYAVYPDGRVMESAEHKFSHLFNGGWSWKPSDKSAEWLHSNTQFCGDYPAPV